MLEVHQKICGERIIWKVVMGKLAYDTTSFIKIKILSPIPDNLKNPSKSKLIKLMKCKGTTL